MSDESTKVKKSILKKWWVWLSAVVVIIIIIASTGKDEKNSSSAESKDAVEDTKQSSEVEQEDLKLLDWDVVSGEYSSKIVGKVKNNTDEEFSYVQITFNLYDESGALVGSAMANVNNLEANGVWKFEAAALEKFKTAKFKEITKF
jgi:hypothetical protein